MKYLKSITCIGLAVIMLLASSSTVNAASHKGACGATLYKVQCGQLIEMNASMGAHVLYYTNNGTAVSCTRTAEKHLHNILCSGCGVLLSGNQIRNCTIKHSVCSDERYVCQY